MNHSVTFRDFCEKNLDNSSDFCPGIFSSGIVLLSSSSVQIYSFQISYFTSTFKSLPFLFSTHPKSNLKFSELDTSEAKLIQHIFSGCCCSQARIILGPWVILFLLIKDWPVFPNFYISHVGYRVLLKHVYKVSAFSLFMIISTCSISSSALMTSCHNLGADLHIDLFFPTFDFYIVYLNKLFSRPRSL